MPGLLYVVSGPSGAGKGTLCRLLCSRVKTACLSVSATTRSPRVGEQEGKEYYFKSKSDFLDMVARDQFLEWAQVYDHYYGTPRSMVEEFLQKGRDVILEIDVQGGLKVRRQLADAVLVFVVPPSFEELQRRLVGRETETPDEVRERLRWAEGEMASIPQYDYVVVNDLIENAVTKMISIMCAEQCRTKRFGLRQTECGKVDLP